MRQLLIGLNFIMFVAFAFTKEIKLPKPSFKGSVSVEEAISKNKATRRFKDLPLTLQQISQLLWAAFGFTVDGITSATRVFPSAGAIYPLELYIVCGENKGLKAGIYKYQPQTHTLLLIKQGDFREQLTKCAFNQFFISQAPVSFVWAANYNKVFSYGERGRVRYIHIDLGHSAQNLTLQTKALGLGTVQVGAFNDEEVKNLLGLSKEEVPVYIMPVGYSK